MLNPVYDLHSVGVLVNPPAAAEPSIRTDGYVYLRLITSADMCERPGCVGVLAYLPAYWQIIPAAQRRRDF